MGSVSQNYFEFINYFFFPFRYDESLDKLISYERIVLTDLEKIEIGIITCCFYTLYPKNSASLCRSCGGAMISIDPFFTQFA